MSALEDAAGRAWDLMFNWAMPPRIALGFVEEQTDGDVANARGALLLAAVAASANARPSATEQTGGSFPDFEAGQIGGAILRGDFAFAQTILDNLKHRLFQQELNPTTEIRNLAGWISWAASTDRTIHLCAEICRPLAS